MSGNYSASQFDHAFKPTNLRNWQYGTNPYPGKLAICSPIRCGCTGFIACDNGHLCPCSSRNCCTSPWGDYGLHIWEQTKPCCCIDMVRRPELYRPPADIYITKVPPKCRKPSVVVDPKCFEKCPPKSCCPCPGPCFIDSFCFNTRLRRRIGCGPRFQRRCPPPRHFRLSCGWMDMCRTGCKRPDWIR